MGAWEELERCHVHGDICHDAWESIIPLNAGSGKFFMECIGKDCSIGRLESVNFSHNILDRGDGFSLCIADQALPKR